MDPDLRINYGSLLRPLHEGSGGAIQRTIDKISEEVKKEL